jgi:hypothetical protein
MVAKSDPDLNLNDEFFAVRKRQLSNEEKLEQIRSIQIGRAFADPNMPTSQPSLRQRQEVGMPALGETGEPMTASEYADLIGIVQPPPPPSESESESDAPPLREGHTFIEVPIGEPQDNEIIDIENFTVEEAAEDDGLESRGEARPDMVAQPRIPRDGDFEEVVADLPILPSESPEEVEPEDFVESPVNTTEPMEDDDDDDDKTKSDDWSVIENPFANPFFDTSAFAIRKDRPRGFVNPALSPPIDEIQKEEKPPELNGFQTKKEDDLSLLPSSMLIKDNSVGDDLSLLPGGWKND